jgi:solute carrier family 35 protein C2
LCFIFRLGQELFIQLHLLNKKTFAHIGFYIGIFGSSALLAFCLEFSEFLLVSNTSSLTLSVSGIFKVDIWFYFIEFKIKFFKEIVMLYLAVEYNENKLNPINIAGLVICLIGIVFHCVLKFHAFQSTRR